VSAGDLSQDPVSLHRFASIVFIRGFLLHGYG